MRSERKKLNRALIDAVVMNDAGQVRSLLQQGADVNAKDNEHEETPLMLAVKFAGVSLMRMLIESGADVNARDDKGQTALFFADALSEKFKVLIYAGADMNARNDEGETILIKKVGMAASLSEVEELLRLGIDPSARDSSGETALGIAENMGLVKVVERLREL